MSTKARLITGFGITALLIGAYFITTMVMGAAIGETCDKEWGCKGLDSVCLEGDAQLCSRHCEADGDCPSGWTCGSVSVLTFDGKSAEPEKSTAPVCLPAPAPAPPSQE